MPSNKPYTFRANDVWKIYFTTDRTSTNFSKEYGFTLEEIEKIKENPTYQKFEGRELRTAQAIQQTTRSPYHEGGYIPTSIATLFGASTIGIALTTLLTAVINTAPKPPATQLTLTPLSATQVDGIKDTAFAFAALANNFTLPTNITFDSNQLKNITYLALGKALELAVQQLNSTLIHTQLQPQPTANDTNQQLRDVAIGAFCVAVSSALGGTALNFLAHYRKTRETEQKRLYDQQKAIMQKLPAIKEEIEFKERVLNKLINFIANKHVPSSSNNNSKMEAETKSESYKDYEELIKLIEEADNLEIYSELNSILDSKGIIEFHAELLKQLKKDVEKEYGKEGRKKESDLNLYKVFKKKNIEKFMSAMQDFADKSREQDCVRFIFEKMLFHFRNFKLIASSQPTQKSNVTDSQFSFFSKETKKEEEKLEKSKFKIPFDIVGKK